jgi:hypothetical protein
MSSGNLVAKAVEGHIIDIYDGCLNVADYLCGRWRSAERCM